MAEKAPGNGMSPEELHSRVLRFESKTGGLFGQDRESEFGPRLSQPTPGPQTGGYVLYERAEDGQWAAHFHDGEEQA